MPLAAAVVGSAVVGGVASNMAASKAAKASTKATDASIALQREQAAQTRSDLMPFMQPGYSAVSKLSDRFGLSSGQGGAAPSAASYGQPAPTGGTRSTIPGMTMGGYGGTPNGVNGPAADPQAQPNVIPYAGGAISLTQQPDGSYAMPSSTSAPTGQPATLPAASDPAGQPATMPAAGGPTGAATSPAVPTGTYGNATNPTYADPGAFAEPAPFHFTADDYTASPAYQYQVDQALKGTMASASVTGSLRSGAAAKALQDRAQNIAMQDFGNERNFAYGKYTDQRNFGRASYDTDRAFNRQTYADDRNYMTGRFDNETGNLFNIANMGANAAAGSASAGANYANNAGNALMANAGNVGNAALAGANSMNGLLSSGVNALAYSNGAGGAGGINSSANWNSFMKSPYVR